MRFNRGILIVLFAPAVGRGEGAPARAVLVRYE
jgi:hypothetical protein